MNDKALPCIVCGKDLENVDGPNQPSGGTAFSATGHYGSTVFDPMDGSMLEINVCDECLNKRAKEGSVLRYGPRHYQTYQSSVSVWDGQN